MFKYSHFVCDSESLEGKLNEMGVDGWRLHTCEPMLVPAPEGDGLLMIVAVVMDKVEPVTVSDEPEPQETAMPMKG